jgi:hypothetical protein
MEALIGEQPFGRVQDSLARGIGHGHPGIAVTERTRD